MDGCAVWEISSAHEIQISKQISAGDMGDDGKSIIRLMQTRLLFARTRLLYKNFIGITVVMYGDVRTLLTLVASSKF